jgi:hypothetical protein
LLWGVLSWEPTGYYLGIIPNIGAGLSIFVWISAIFMLYRLKKLRTMTFGLAFKCCFLIFSLTLAINFISKMFMLGLIDRSLIEQMAEREYAFSLAELEFMGADSAETLESFKEKYVNRYFPGQVYSLFFEVLLAALSAVILSAIFQIKPTQE